MKMCTVFPIEHGDFAACHVSFQGQLLPISPFDHPNKGHVFTPKRVTNKTPKKGHWEEPGGVILFIFSNDLTSKLANKTTKARSFSTATRRCAGCVARIGFLGTVFLGALSGQCKKTWYPPVD